MIGKPGKNPADVTSYRPINLSKIIEKIILRGLTPFIADNKLITSHEFGFRTKHVTIEQVHRVIHKINDDLENKRFCIAAFIDISQALDKVWHAGLLGSEVPAGTIAVVTGWGTNTVSQYIQYYVTELLIFCQTLSKLTTIYYLILSK
jgi:hypothetical protein